MITRKMSDFIPVLQKRYPDLDEKTIKKVINFGCHSIMNFLKDGDDVMIESSRKKVKMVIYNHRNYWDEKKKCQKPQ